MRPSTLPHDLRDRPFTTQEAFARELSPRRLRARDLHAPFHAVRVTDRATHPAVAFAVLLRRRHFFSHATAAQLHDLRMPLRISADSRVHVGAFPPDGYPRARGVVGHEIRRTGVTIGTVGGLRVVSPVDTWLQLAAVLSVDELIVMGDGLVRRVNPQATMAGLRDAVNAAAGLSGAPRLRAALPLIRARTDSAQETLLRLAIVRAGLPEPLVNLAIVDADGRFLGFADLAFTAQRVIVEYDGDHHREAEQYRIDIDRLDAFMAEGWRVIRVNRSHGGPVARDALLRRIARALAPSAR